MPGYGSRMLIGMAAVLAASAGLAQPVALNPAALNMVEQADPAMPTILPMRERAAITNAWLRERLDTVVPPLMRENGVDMWVLIARENLEDPVVATMLNAESLRARRRTILVFFDPGAGKPVERLTVSRYGLGGMFAPSWDPDREPDQWKRLAEIIAERNPKKVAINTSSLTAFADGITLSQYRDMMAALPPAAQAKIVPGEKLAVGWLETRTPAEMARYPEVVRAAHAIIAEGFSSKVITPGKTTTADVVWWFRDRIAEVRLSTWFQPSVAISRQGSAAPIEGEQAVIQKGDMLWCDFGIIYLGLHTDTQHLGYVLKDGERDAPAGLKAGFAANNAVQDALTSSFRAGDGGNTVLSRAIVKARAAGFAPTIYTHPLGFHGHAAGSSIGYWDNQKGAPSGEYPIRPNTGWSIELAAAKIVPEWGNQMVSFKSEEDAFFGRAVRYIDGRQTAFHLIGNGR